MSCDNDKPTTKCNLYKPGDKNVWVERGDTPGSEDCPGICLLDTMSRDQVIYVLEHDAVARKDLHTVTTDPELIKLANEVVGLPTAELTDMQQSVLNHAHEPATVPFYAIFRGNPPFAQ